jgi:hypothetical protein
LDDDVMGVKWNIIKDEVPISPPDEPLSSGDDGIVTPFIRNREGRVMEAK